MSLEDRQPAEKLVARVAVAMRSSPDIEELRSTLHLLGLDVVATAASLGELNRSNQASQIRLVFADLEALKSQGSSSDSESGQTCELDSGGLRVPIVLVGPSTEQKLDQVLGYLARPFSPGDVSNVVDSVLKNESEFRWLHQQCDTYRTLIERLRQKMGNFDLKSLGSVKQHDEERDDPTFTVPDDTSKETQTFVTPALVPELDSFETIPHAIQEVDPSGRILFSNPAHCALHGYEPGTMTGRSIWELLASEQEQENFRLALKDRLRNAPPPVSYTTRHRRRDGRIIDVQVDWTYKRDAQGDVEGYISIITDITQQLLDRRELQLTRENAASREAKLAEQLSTADQALLEETNRRRVIEKALRHSRRLASLGVIAAGIAHEINNPITAGMNSAETALAIGEKNALPSELVQCLVNVVHSTRRCRAIVKDLLKFASQQPTEKRVYSLNYVVKRAIGIVKKVHPDWPASLQLELSDRELHVQLNLLEIEVALANLVQNAMEAARGNPQGKVIVRTQLAGEQAILMVTDNGCGIPKEALEQIFDPFFTTRRGAGGTGLGLSIVYAIIRNHRGEIEVVSTEGVGTTFTINFPRIVGETHELEDVTATIH